MIGEPGADGEHWVQRRVWHIYPDVALLQRRVAEGVTRLAQAAIAARGEFRIVLAGGSTPRAVYKGLRGADADWRAWQVYFGDERCLPADHPERNDGMARAAWLAHVAIPAAQIHAIPAELGPEQGARRYAATLQGAGGFDLVLLGLGEDGHTASLFPGLEWGCGDGAPPALAVYGAPKAPPQRVSMSARRLAGAQAVWFLATGPAKRAALEAWRGGAAIPAAAIAPEHGVEIFTDQML